MIKQLADKNEMHVDLVAVDEELGVAAYVIRYREADLSHWQDATPAQLGEAEQLLLATTEAAGLGVPGTLGIPSPVKVTRSGAVMYLPLVRQDVAKIPGRDDAVADGGDFTTTDGWATAFQGSGEVAFAVAKRKACETMLMIGIQLQAFAAQARAAAAEGGTQEWPADVHPDYLRELRGL